MQPNELIFVFCWYLCFVVDVNIAVDGYTTLVLVVLANPFSANFFCLFVLVFVDVYIGMAGHATPV